MKIKKEKRFKHCPRCGLKTFNNAKVCGRCDLSFEKFDNATNYEAKQALRKGEKYRVLNTTKLPQDVNKWELFFISLFLGWAGIHLWKVGKINRAITHSMGLIFACFYIISYTFDVTNIFIYNLGNILGAFWAVTFVMSSLDIFAILFNSFKVPVSLPEKEEK